MENKVSVRQSRSLTRRVAVPLCFSVATLAGAGWGVHHYVTGTQIEETAAPSEIAHSAPIDSDRLKNMFAEETPKLPADKVEADKPKQARYSLTAEEPSATLAAEPKVSLKTSSTSLLGDRYASVAANPFGTSELKTEANVAQTEESLLEEPSAPSEPVGSPNVARGQGPSANPLRAGKQQTKEADAFEAKPLNATTAPASPLPVASNPPNNNTAEAASEAMFNPRPLPQKAANQPSSRYEQSPPELGAPPVGFGASARPKTVTQRPAPAFGIDQPLNVKQPPTRTPIAPLTAQRETASERITPTPGITNRPGTGRPGEQLLEGEQTPSITILKLAPEEIQVGKRCTIAIRVQNTGQRTAQNVQVYDEVPLGTELVGTAPRAAVSGTKVVWDLGTLSVGEERTVEMELIPVEEGELGSVATVTMAAQASAKSLCTRPELALRLTSGPQVLEGEQHIVQIEISNPGSGDATGVMLIENLPQGVSHEAGPALEYEIGTLRPGESRRMDLILTAEQAGKINNVMTARADANLRVEASCEFEVIAPELLLTIEGPQRRYLERPATYRISVDNPGTATAQEVQLVTKLPKGLQFVSANNLGEYDASDHSVRWSLAELPANERGTVELVALPVEAGEQIIQASTSAGQTLEDRAEKAVQVEGLAALTFEVTDRQGLIEVGGETTYEIVVANQGSKAATNVEVVVVMPPGMRALSGQGETRHTIQGERVTFAPLPQLAPKAETTLRVQAQGVRPGDQRVRVHVKTDGLQQPITKEVNTRVYADE